MYAVPQIDVILNNRDRLLQKRSSPKKKQANIHTFEDKAEISPIVSILFRTGMDIKNSFVDEQFSELGFNLEFKTNSFEKLSAKGDYQKDSEVVHAFFEYQFQKEAISSGNSRHQFYSLTLSYTMKNLDKNNQHQIYSKQDIISLVRDILQDVEGQIFIKDITSGNNFTLDELIEMSGIDKRNFIKKLVHLTLMTITLSEMRIMVENDSFSESLNLKTEKEMEMGIQTISDSALISNFSLGIKDITDTIGKMN